MRSPARLPIARDERGFSLLEVMVAAVITVIAVLGLAYSFSTGRGFIDRFATARDALSAAEQRIERLAILSLKDPAHTELTIGPHGPLARQLNENQTGTESWSVTWVDDPADNPGDLNPNDYKRATVTVRWMQGGLRDSVSLDRVFLAP